MSLKAPFRSLAVRRAWTGLLVPAVVMTLAGCAAGEPEGVSGTEDSPQSLKKQAEGWADFLGVEDPPEVKPVRYVETEERDEVVLQCLSEAGYTIIDGGVDVPTGNEEAFALAQYTCYMQYPVPERYAQPWGEEQVRAQYAWTIDFVIPCLEERGHPIAPPPSESVFVDSYDSDPYYPFVEVNLAVPEAEFNAAWYQLEADCPQEVPGSVLWDGLSLEEWKRNTGR